MGYGEATVPTIVPNAAAAKQFRRSKKPLTDITRPPAEGSSFSNGSLLRKRLRISHLPRRARLALRPTARPTREIASAA